MQTRGSNSSWSAFCFLMLECTLTFTPNASPVGTWEPGGQREEGDMGGLRHSRPGVDLSGLLPVVCQRGPSTQTAIFMDITHAQSPVTDRMWNVSVRDCLCFRSSTHTTALGSWRRCCGTLTFTSPPWSMWMDTVTPGPMTAWAFTDMITNRVSFPVQSVS